MSVLADSKPGKSEIGAGDRDLVGFGVMDDLGGAGSRVFLSYVPEDSGRVDSLQAALESAGFRVWRDTRDVFPGEDWRARIRQVISGQAGVFLACFSSRGLLKERSFQRTELMLGVDELRLRDPESRWLIPVRFDDCVVPDWDIGLGRSLASLRSADLFGGQSDDQLSLLIRAIELVARPAAAGETGRVLPGSVLGRSTAMGNDSWAPGFADGRHGLLEGMLRSIVVQVMRGSVRGSGYLVAPGTVLTSARLAGEGLTVRWEGADRPALTSPVTEYSVLPSRGRVSAGPDGGYPGVAVLSVAGFGEHPCAGLDWSRPDPSDVFTAYGYPAEDDTPLLTPMRLRYRGMRGNDPAAVLELGSDVVKPGMSGAPLLNHRTGGVCGIVSASRHSDRPGVVLAVPLYALIGDLAGAGAENGGYHRAHPGWAEALNDEQVRTGSWRRPGPRLRAYLAAAAAAAQQHPYLDSLNAPLTSVYVRQQVAARAPQDDAADRSSGQMPSGGGYPDQDGGRRPAQDLLSRADSCVVVGEPGAGKSSLVRCGLIAMAERWLSGGDDDAVPVAVTAADLADGLSLPEAIGRRVRSDLRHADRLAKLPDEMFDSEPMRGVRWLVFVDGLDEIPSPLGRAEVIRSMTAATTRSSPYRFFMTTRPLPAGQLPRGLGWARQPYELQPFETDQLCGFSAGWLTHLGASNPDDLARRFTMELDQAGLAELARLPLMATMLIQLFNENSGKSLPQSRPEVYREFINHLHNHQYLTPTGDSQPTAALGTQVENLVSQYGPAAKTAAGQLLDQSPSDIRRLAAARIDGDTRPPADVLEPWTGTLRPGNILARDWNTLVTEILRRSGVLLERTGELVFLHQTITEYLAAENTVTDPDQLAKQRDALLGIWMKPHWWSTRRTWQPPTMSSSYARFLLAAWITHGAESDRPKLESAMVRLARRGGLAGRALLWELAADRVDLGMAVGTELRSALLRQAQFRHRLADLTPAWLDSAIPSDVDLKPAGLLAGKLPDRLGEILQAWLDEPKVQRSLSRVAAIFGLTQLGDPDSNELLAACAADQRVTTAQLAISANHWPFKDAQASILYAAILDRPPPPGRSTDRSERDLMTIKLNAEHRRYRINAATRLAEMGDSRGIQELAAQAGSSDDYTSLYAAKALADLGDPRGAEILTLLADHTEGDYFSIERAAILAEMQDPAGLETLNVFARIYYSAKKFDKKRQDQGHRSDNTSLNIYSGTSVHAIEKLIQLGENQWIDRLVEIASADYFHGTSRAKAAKLLADLGDPRGTELLAAQASAAIPDDDSTILPDLAAQWERDYAITYLRELGDERGTRFATTRDQERQLTEQRKRYKNLRLLLAAGSFPAVAGLSLGIALAGSHGNHLDYLNIAGLATDCLAVFIVTRWLHRQISKLWRRKSRRFWPRPWASANAMSLVLLPLMAALGYIASQIQPGLAHGIGWHLWNMLIWR